MITSFDDYCIHQTHEPDAQPSQSDRNFYDRYWFNGFDTGGAFLFEIGFGLYPNRRVMDGHFSVVVDGVRFNYVAAADRAGRGGPLVSVQEPLRRVRVRLRQRNRHRCDLLFMARRQSRNQNDVRRRRLIMHNSRFRSSAAGRLVQGGGAPECRRGRRARATSLWGRAASWRPGRHPPGKMNGEPGVYWVWSPIGLVTSPRSSTSRTATGTDAARRLHGAGVRRAVIRARAAPCDGTPPHHRPAAHGARRRESRSSRPRAPSTASRLERAAFR
jgi:hypothetical protein